MGKTIDFWEIVPKGFVKDIMQVNMATCNAIENEITEIHFEYQPMERMRTMAQQIRAHLPDRLNNALDNDSPFMCLKMVSGRWIFIFPFARNLIVISYSDGSMVQGRMPQYTAEKMTSIEQLKIRLLQFNKED